MRADAVALLFPAARRTGARRLCRASGRARRLLAAIVGVAGAGAPALTRWLGAGTLAPLGAPLAVTAALMLASTPLESALTASGRIELSRSPRLPATARRRRDGRRRVLARAGGAVLGGRRGCRRARVVLLVVLFARGLLPLGWPSAALVRAQLRYALPFAGASVFFVGQRYCAQYLVAARVDAATFPIFTIGSFHLPVVDIVFTPVTEVLIVALGTTLATSRRASLEAVQRAVNRLAALLFPAAAGAWLLGSALVPLLFTARYAAAVPLFEIATLLVPFCVLPNDALLRAAGDTRLLLVFSAARVPFTLTLVLVGMRVGGSQARCSAPFAPRRSRASCSCGAAAASSAIRRSARCSIGRRSRESPSPAPPPACPRGACASSCTRRCRWCPRRSSSTSPPTCSRRG